MSAPVDQGRSYQICSDIPSCVFIQPLADFLRGSKGCSFGFPKQYQPSLGYMLWLLIVTGVVSLSSFSGSSSFYNQFSVGHCRSIRRLLNWITAFRCHFVTPLITTVQVPAILHVLQLPRDSVIGSFRRRHPSISLQR